MARPAEFTPAELDRIEDALESLEHAEIPEDLPAAARDRLAAYRSLLVQSREALPLEDVPDGLLDDVMAQARAAGPAVAEREGLWSRFRKSLLVPVIALAGTTALVLWWIQPAGQRAEDAVAQLEAPPPPTPAPVVTPVEEVEADAPDEAEPAATAEPEPVDGLGSEAELEENIAGEKAKEDAEQGLIGGASKGGKGGGRKAAPSKKGSVSTKDIGNLDDDFGDVPSEPNKAEQKRSKNKKAPSPKPAPSSGGTVPAQTNEAAASKLLKRGDGYRRSGRCGLARSDYIKASKSGTKSIKARAYAGLGLCEEANGKDGSGYYAKARAQDPSVDGYISSERRRMQPKKSKKSQKNDAAIEQQNAFDPIGE